MFKKIRNKVNSAVAAVRATVACKKAEGYVDSGVNVPSISSFGFESLDRHVKLFVCSDLIFAIDSPVI